MAEHCSKPQSLDQFPLAEAQAIEVHKYFLSIEAGHDVGIEFAIKHWLDHFSAAWHQARLQEDLEAQRKEIQVHKWIESERAGQDLGQGAVHDWIIRYAAEWRRWREEEAGKSGAGS